MERLRLGRLIHLTSGSTGFEPTSLGLRSARSFCCVHAAFAFVPAVDVYLLATRGTAYSSVQDRRLGWQRGKALSKQAGKVEFSLVLPLSAMCSINILTQGLSPTTSLLVVPGGLGSACQMLTGSPQKAESSGPCFCDCSPPPPSHPSQVWLLPVPAAAVGIP